MSNQLYGPDGNPIPPEDEHTSPQTNNPQEAQQKSPSDHNDIPYPLRQPVHSEESMSLADLYEKTHDYRLLPVTRGPLEYLSLGCGIVSIFMIGYTNFYTLFLMFAAGLSAILLGSLSLSNDHKNVGRMPIVALVMGFTGIALFILTIVTMMFLVNHPDILEQVLETSNQPVDIRDLLR